MRALRPWLESPHHRKVGQHLKYDMHVFANHGLRLAGVAHDTLLESYVLEAHRNNDMDSLAERHLGRKTLTYAEVCGKGVNQLCFDEVAIDRATDYAAEDAEVTLALHQATVAADRTERASCARSTRTSNCRSRRCCSAWSAPAC